MIKCEEGGSLDVVNAYPRIIRFSLAIWCVSARMLV